LVKIKIKIEILTRSIVRMTTGYSLYPHSILSTFSIMTIHEDDVKDRHPVVLLYGISSLQSPLLSYSLARSLTKNLDTKCRNEELLFPRTVPKALARP
jgi:hypothetical protein